MYPAKTIFSERFSAADIQIEILPDSEWKADVSYDTLVAHAWKEKVALAQKDSVRIWDGTYYRVTNIPEIEKDSKLIFRLATVPYRYIATFSVLQKQFLESNFEPLHHLSTAALIRMADSSYLFGKRTRNAAIDFIGGGVQQDEIKIVTGIDLEKNLRKEILEESGIETQHIQSIQGLGIVHSITSNIIVVSLVQLGISEHDVAEVFTHRKDDEMCDLVYVPENNIKSYLQGMTSYRPLIAGLL